MRAVYGELSAGLRAVRPLVRAVGDPLRVAVVDRGSRGAPAERMDALSRVTDSLCEKLTMPRVRLTLDDFETLNVFERAVSRHLALDLDLLDGAPPSGAEVAAASELGGANEDRALVRVKSAGGALLNVYSFGDASSPPVIMINAHGMPVGLSLGWVRVLMRHYRIVTWETRTMFPPDAEFEGVGCDLDSHVADLWSVMDHFGLERAHLIGFCTGVFVALVGAVREPGRFQSLGLGAGQYFWGDSCAETEPERVLRTHLRRFGANRRLAARFQRTFSSPRTKELLQFDDRFAHLTLYPWASGELLHRYSRICLEFMSTPLADWARAVTLPTFVAVGERDPTVHPDSSRRAASLIRGARVYAEPEGDHLSMLFPGRGLVEGFSEFLASTG